MAEPAPESTSAIVEWLTSGASAFALMIAGTLGFFFKKELKRLDGLEGNMVTRERFDDTANRVERRLERLEHDLVPKEQFDATTARIDQRLGELRDDMKGIYGEITGLRTYLIEQAQRRRNGDFPKG